jgi:holo-[acyl-carrier protein] synthase
MMRPDALADYLSNLLGRKILGGDSVALSSAQRARLIGWLESRQVSTDHLTVPATFEVGELSRQVAEVRAAPQPRRGSTVAALPVSGIGIDIQSVSELVKADSIRDLKQDAELCAIFTLRELSYAAAKESPAETLAGLFAAKEALRKADSTLLSMRLTDIEILPDERGAPTFPHSAISISHSGGLAVAVALRAGVDSSSMPTPAAALHQQAGVAEITSASNSARLAGGAAPVAILGWILLGCGGGLGIAWLFTRLAG